MIFVTVGNANQKFGRLLNQIEALGAEGFFCSERVIIQTGHNPSLSSESFESKSFLAMEEFELYIKEADIIISHAGAGTLLNALRQGKIPIVMPRREKYKEHINDHQLQLAQAFSDEGKIIPVYEPSELKQAINIARQNVRELGNVTSNNLPPMIGLIDQAIRELAYKS